MVTAEGHYPHIPFERYADDTICHCQSAKEARALWSALADRLAVCKLVLHPVCQWRAEFPQLWRSKIPQFGGWGDQASF
jgi:hypothetical protein